MLDEKSSALTFSSSDTFLIGARNVFASAPAASRIAASALYFMIVVRGVDSRCV